MKTHPVHLTLAETGALCHLIVAELAVRSLSSDEPTNGLVEASRAATLRDLGTAYLKISAANDRLRET